MIKNAIITGIQKYFESQDWKYDFYEEDDVFQTAVALEGGSGVMIHALVGDSAFTVMVSTDIAFTPEVFDAARLFVNAVNERLLLGTLVIDEEEGILFFRVGQNCGSTAPDAQIIEDAFAYPISFVDENYNTFAALAAGEISAADALIKIFE